MALEIADRWVVLQLSPAGRDRLKLLARDDRGKLRTGSTLSPTGGAPGSGDRTTALELPPSIVELVADAVAGLPERRTPQHGGGRVSLPLFLDFAPGLRDDAERLVSALATGHRTELAGRLQTVHLAPRRWLRRAPFRLPLRVLTAGGGVQWRRIRETSWSQRAEIRTHGLQLEETGSDHLAEALGRTPRDVLLVAARDLLSTLRDIVRGLPANRARPRLVIAAAEPSAGPLYGEALAFLPAGTSLLLVVPPAGAQASTFIEEFMEHVLHDLPLHESLRASVARLGPRWGRSTILVADPLSNQDLRLSLAFAGIGDERIKLVAATPGNFDAFSKRTGIKVTGSTSRQLHLALALAGGVQQHLAATRDLEVSFRRERSSFVKLAAAEASLAQARGVQRRVDRALRSVARDPDFADKVRRRQHRRVDAALQSLESIPVRGLLKSSTLRRGARYRLRVHVGRRGAASIMSGKPPPLDPLLPAPQRQAGHTLHVVVYERDFVALSPRLRTLHLPDLGGSSPVYFELRAPIRDGPAHLRLKVYHGNQLLQSFLLTAEVAIAETTLDKNTLHLDLVYSRTARFGNLAAFEPRALSIGVNQDPSGNSHTFMFKVGKEVEAIDLSEQLLQDQITRFRDVLRDATVDAKGNPRFASLPQPGVPPSEEFYQVIRALADAGGALHDALWVRMSAGLKARLRKVAETADKTIQLVRDDPNFVFPWATLYDYPLPERRVGEPPQLVCLGFAPGELPGDPPLKRCSHGPGDAAYCVWGFWGLRHALEVLLARSGIVEDEVPAVQRASREAAVCLAVGADDQVAVDFVDNMQQDFKSAVKVMKEDDDLLDRLWSPAQRPALLVVLGHLETAALAGEPPEDRIVLVPQKKWFLAGPVTRREKSQGAWEQPKTVVLVMGCGTAATTVSTLNDFVTALSSAGAAAVVGTECPAFTGLVARFAHDITTDLWNGGKLGESIKLFRRRLVAAGNPLAFVFSATGNADLSFDLSGV